MKVFDVITEYHLKCPFPWTPTKLKKKGYDVKTMLIEIRKKLALCTDREDAKSAELIKALMAIDI